MAISDEVVASAPVEPAPRPRRRALRIVALIAAVLVVVLIAAVVWFFVGREQASEVDTNEALEAFRSESNATASTSASRDVPAPGVYTATVTGEESIGLPGFDESYGPNSPVTVTHGDGGCFSYRVDFNSHHWRAWTFCPSPTATFALTQMDGWTARSAPGFDLSTYNTYACTEPADFWWDDPTTTDSPRTGTCVGTNDLDDGVTDDALRIEVVGSEPLTIGGARVNAIHLRSTESFSRDQTGQEVDDWWVDADTGLPVRLTIDSSLTGGSGDYREKADVTLTSVTPKT